MTKSGKFIKISMLPAIALGFHAMTFLPANAQSFSCANAQIPSELAICNNEDLLVMDEKVASLFAEIRTTIENNAQVQEISEKHSNWLRKRNACRVNFGCLKRQYRTRIRSLETAVNS